MKERIYPIPQRLCTDCGCIHIHWNLLKEVEYEGQPVYDGSSYYENLDEYMTYLIEEKATIPPYVQLAIISNINTLIYTDDILIFIKGKLQENFESDWDVESLEGISDLRQSIEKFREKQTLTFFEPTPYKIKIPLVSD